MAAPGPGGIPQFASLYVGDLHPDVTEAMLYEIFNSVGPVGSIRVCRDSVSRRSLGYAYVNFHAVADAERALDTLNYSSIKGRSCRIGWSQRDPSLRKSGVGNIHVKNLDRNIDNKALYDTFSLFGNILSCKVACAPDGKSRGYGFVHYETEEAAKQAIERVNGMQIGEKTVQVSPFVKGNERMQEKTNFTNLYIRSFPNDWDEEKVTEMFTPFGTITSKCVMADAKGRKFAFVNFETSEDALACVEAMHDKDLRTDEEKAAAAEGDEYEKLFVQRAQSKAERQAQFRQMRQQETGSNGRAQGVNLYVKNLDESTDDASLRELFEPFGAITSVAAMKDEKGLCKGFGFVAFSSPDEATKAVTEMHLKVVKGKPLYVGLAEKREAREERLRQRYSPGMGGKGKGGKGGCMMGPGGGMPPQMYGGGGMQNQMGGMMGMPRPMMNPMGGMMGPMGGMMGKGGMPGQMMGMPPQMGGKGGAMMNPQQMMMGGKGGMPPGGNKGGPGGMPMMGMPPNMGQMGMMRPMMPQQMQQRPMAPGGGGCQGGPQAQMRPPQQAVPAQPTPAGPGQPLNAANLAAAPPGVQKQMIGEKLYPQIAKHQPELAGKVTGMMLEMDNSELLMLLESEQQLKAKVDEALRVLQGQS
mmetsp:Transcript_87761/g.160539  ORF Transcript_87761/g.160539 Transcript_87761/m.160539 type:complete len:640 (+) Transcript_87761:131-2050(+)